ncbi:MAG TPA: peroxide stress protein YaaA [Gammaproteobacteria bacterium]|nr:peroxide stress protein YaaA [Gammaproteobacteria bacterium]
MLAVISPAKTLDFETPAKIEQYSQPRFLSQSQQLIDVLSQLSPAQIGSLMKLSDSLSGLNVGRYQTWSQPFTPDNAKQAIFAFKGDVYTGLDAEHLTKEAVDYSQQHLRILSGLYGLLKPLDLIQPYRLEMGTKLTTPKGQNLYQFWGEKLCHAMDEDVIDSGTDTIINLASNEYFKALQATPLKSKVITPIFKDWKKGQYKIISFYAKKARGVMSRYLLENQITEATDLQQFNEQGYYFSDTDSDETTWVFLRDEIKS